MKSPGRPLIIWRFSDGKAGHNHQSQGLTEALGRLRQVEVVEPSLLSTASALRALVVCPIAWRALPPPDLLIGAGHRTHFSLLAARHHRGGKSVVLMRPSLPLGVFDLCLIPEHDTPPVRANVLSTRGALNHIPNSTTLEPKQGLFLIGGPSAHFGWNDDALQAQIVAVLSADPTMCWTLTTSRRTPDSFLAHYRDQADTRLTVVPVEATGSDWLPAQLARAGQVWVSADSVSMIYEALTAGAAVGVLDVPRIRSTRISRGLDNLASAGWVTPFAAWQRQPHLKRPSGAFNEAERCAHWIVEQWFR